MNFLPELGLGALCADEDYFMNTIGKYVIENGRVFKGYYGSYIWKRHGTAELNFHIEPDKDGHRVSGFTSNISGDYMWRLEITAAEDKYNAYPDEDDYDPLSPVVEFTHPLTKQGEIFIHLVNADVVPSYSKGDVYSMQVVAVADKVRYYEDEKAFEKEHRRDVILNPYIFTTGLLEGRGIKCRAVGKIKRIWTHYSYDQEGKIVKFLGTEIRTPFGDLEILTSEAAGKRKAQLMSSSPILEAECTVLGDVAVGAYQMGAVFDEEHIVRLLCHCFRRQDFLRSSRLFADKCTYTGMTGEIGIKGGDAVYKYLDRIAKRRKASEEPLNAYFAHLEEYPRDPQEKDPVLLAQKIGSPCLAISQQENGDADLFMFIRLDENQKIAGIRTISPSAASYEFSYEQTVFDEDEDDDYDYDDEPFSSVIASNSETGWLKIMQACYDNGNFDNTAFYYGLLPNCVLDNQWCKTNMNVYSRETMFTYLNSCITHEKHDIKAYVISGTAWGHRMVLKVNIDGNKHICAIDVNRSGKIAVIHEYPWTERQEIEETGVPFTGNGTALE